MRHAVRAIMCSCAVRPTRFVRSRVLQHHTCQTLAIIHARQTVTRAPPRRPSRRRARQGPRPPWRAPPAAADGERHKHQAPTVRGSTYEGGSARGRGGRERRTCSRARMAAFSGCWRLSASCWPTGSSARAVSMRTFGIGSSHSRSTRPCARRRANGGTPMRLQLRCRHAGIACLLACMQVCAAQVQACSVRAFGVRALQCVRVSARACGDAPRGAPGRPARGRARAPRSPWAAPRAGCGCARRHRRPRAPARRQGSQEQSSPFGMRCARAVALPLSLSPAQPSLRDRHVRLRRDDSSD